MIQCESRAKLVFPIRLTCLMTVCFAKGVSVVEITIGTIIIVNVYNCINVFRVFIQLFDY